MTKTYWQDKVSLWLHDPPHKMFDIQGHETRSAVLAAFWGITTPDQEIYQQADMIATGLTRAALPAYDSNAEKNGEIDFQKNPTLTHPLVRDREIRLDIGDVQINSIHQELCDLLQKDLGLDQTFEQLQGVPVEKRPLGGFFDRKDKPEEWSKALYFYLFFALQKRLRQENAGQLGGLWELLPADSRMPDHPLWHHAGLTSAIGSCLDADPKRETALAVFAITPVQAFIGNARKLRDHWAGSVILSYLAFAGIKHIASTLGPDHVLYPSLHDQSLVEAWIGKDFHLERFLEEQNDDVLKMHQELGKSIASFPNKFVFLAPASQAGEICRKVENAVQEEWLRLARLVKETFLKKYDAGQVFAGLFEHQISDYWQLNYAACRLVGLSGEDREALARLLHEWEGEAQTIKAFAQEYKDPETGRLYGASHTLAQSLLAAAKLKPTRIRKPQQGEKCPLCGEHEVLHDFSGAGKSGAAEYSEAVKKFWDNIRSKENPGENNFTQVGKNERLCAICAIKRFLPQILSSPQKDELLTRARVFAKVETFPSTTKMAAHRYLLELTDKKILQEEEKEYKQLIDVLHNFDVEPEGDDLPVAGKIIEEARKKEIYLTNRDKYYALLLMDGDKMGDLINGKTLSATWNDVLHPDLRKRFEKENFRPESPLKPRLNKIRLLNPALHAAISDGLNSFARH
ncbi:MAG: type III-B CRISPR-associated protein Cas10/Cmr2, partial [Deltaproteobacteria bacterium]|nr:type III-B CRISPR-associated protein Cas10/Cmr2 [Deltaproteobacteria bacterium]